MAADPLAGLRQELKGEVKGLDRLDASAQNRLLELLASAHRHQRRELDKALNDVLNHVPLLLRGVAKRAFFHE